MKDSTVGVDVALDTGQLQLRSLSASLDRIREAAGVGPDTDVEDLTAAVAELRQERDEALAEVARLAAELERWPTALTVDGTTGDGQ